MSPDQLPDDPKSRNRLKEKLKRAEALARKKAIAEREKFRGLQIRPTATLFDSRDEKEPGEDNWSGMGFDIHPQVTIGSVLILSICLTLALMFKEQAGEVTEGMLHWISSTFGWFFILAAVNDNVARSMFEMLQHFPLSQLLSVVGVLLVTIFFVTSSDSGSLVVDHLTSGGKLDSPVAQRVFWAVMEGLVAGVLLLGGGLTTLQTATIITGLPFALVILLMIYALYLGLQEELYVEEAVKRRLQNVMVEHRVSEAVASAQEAVDSVDSEKKE